MLLSPVFFREICKWYPRKGKYPYRTGMILSDEFLRLKASEVLYVVL